MKCFIVLYFCRNNFNDTKLERISKEDLDNIDIDIYSLMKKMPNNELYNSLYIRWEKETHSTFSRILCNLDDLTGLLGVLIYKDKHTKKEVIAQIVEPSKCAILNLAVHILSEKSNDDIEEFIELTKKVKNEKNRK